MTGRLEGKRALITAAGQGIGKAAALAFAREGAMVFATDVNEAALACFDGAARIEAFLLDATSDRSVNEGVARARPDILFNCAGFVHNGTILDASDAEWEFAFDLNVRSMFRTIRAALPGMLERGGGSIVNMSSVVSLIGLPDLDFYTVAKGGISALTRALARQHAASGIRVNAIAPGITMTERVLAASGGDTSRFPLAQKQLLGAARPEDIAAAALYLASNEAAKVTGVVLPIDGGATAW